MERTFSRDAAKTQKTKKSYGFVFEWKQTDTHHHFVSLELEQIFRWICIFGIDFHQNWSNSVNDHDYQKHWAVVGNLLQLFLLSW